MDNLFSIIVNDNHDYIKIPFGYQCIYCLSAGIKCIFILCYLYSCDAHFSVVEL